MDMDVSVNRGTPKSSILIGFSIINHPFWGTPIFGNTHISLCWQYHYHCHLQETWCDEGPMNDVSMDGPEGPMIGVVPWMADSTNFPLVA